MPLAAYSSAAFTTGAGLAVAASASVSVRRESDGALAEIFSDEDGLVAKANPFSADASGRFEFYAAGSLGGYRITVSDEGEEYTLNNVSIGTAGQYDAAEKGGEFMALEDTAAALALLLAVLTSDQADLIALDGDVEARSSNEIIEAGDFGKTFILTGDDWTQTFDLPETLGSKFRASFRNAGTGIITFSPTGSPTPTIDGRSSIRVYPGEAFVVRTDGTHFYTFGRQKEVVITSTEASGASTVEFTDGFDDTEFESLRLEINSLAPSVDNAYFEFRVSEDGGSTYKSGASDYGWVGIEASSGSTPASTAGDDADDAMRILRGGTGNASGECAQAVVYLPDPNSATDKLFSSKGNRIAITGITVISEAVMVSYSNLAFNALQFFPSSGTFSGSFRLIGVRA